MGKHKYSNEEITVNWDSEVCIHSEVCVKNLGKVFDINKKPWVNVEGAETGEITNLIHTCPSGALSYELANKPNIENKETIMSSEKTKVTIAENGPYLIKGEFTVEDAQGNQVETKEMAALCRCGASSNKPFCDGTHKKIDFEG